MRILWAQRGENLQDASRRRIVGGEAGRVLPTKETGRDESARKRTHSNYELQSQLSGEEPWK